MLSVRLPSWLVFLAWLAPARAQLPHLPFTLDDPDGHWRLVPATRPLPEGLELMATLAPRVGPPRLMIFKVPATPQVPDALAAFAEKLRKIVIVEPMANIRSASAERIGYTGHLVSLDAPRANGVFTCEIFAFAVGSDYWGLLQIVPADDQGAQPFTALKKAPPVPTGAVALAPYQVHEDPVTSFPVALRVTRQTEQDRVANIFVTGVPEGSLTEQLGVKVGDEILRLEGRPVTAFAGGVSRRSELGRILLDRRPGSTLELQIRTPGETKTYSVTLIAGRVSGPMRPW